MSIDLQSCRTNGATIWRRMWGGGSADPGLCLMLCQMWGLACMDRCPAANLGPWSQAHSALLHIAPWGTTIIIVIVRVQGRLQGARTARKKS